MSYFRWWIAGGNNEVGANSHVVEYIYKDENGHEKTYCFIQELGVSFADRHKSDDPDYFYPNVTEYLQKYEDSSKSDKPLAKAIVLTHGHLDHIGAIAVLAKEGYRLPKIYGTKRTISLIRDMLSSLEVETNLDFVYINPVENTKLLPIKLNPYLTLNWYPVSHSVSGTGGFLYVAKDSTDKEPINICFQIDFKTDPSVLIEPGYSRPIVQEIGKRKISTCFLESTRATEPGKNSKEMQIMDNIDAIIKKHSGKRIVATTMATNDQRLAIFLYLAAKNDRKFIYFGRAMASTISVMKEDIAQSIKNRFDIEIDFTNIINGKEVNVDEIPEEQQLVMLTGTQAEEGAAMTLASKEEHKKFTFNEHDIMIDSASVIPGNEDFVFPMMKKIGKVVEKVYLPPKPDIHASGHGKADELAEFLRDIAKTDLRSLVAIHGAESHRMGSKNLAEKVNEDIKYYGHKPFEILMPRNGDILKIDATGAKIVDNNDKEFLKYFIPKDEFFK